MRTNMTVERTGRFIANDTNETVDLNAEVFLETFADDMWDVLGQQIRVPLSSYEEDLIPWSQLDDVIEFLQKAIHSDRFTPPTAAVLTSGIDLMERARKRRADVWIVF
jgi:hypothetical protein